ncbi:MAG: LysR family transcriptional regulator [Firmicutes bacterium]|nr:LysR family transcriptional regulator [Bacillota bacterium]
MENINLNSLKIFYEVANSKSFLDAANKLFVSQPAVSKSMSKLEEDLGVLLFYRDNKGIELTPSGEILYKYLKDIKDLLMSCNRVLMSMNDTEEGRIIIGVRSHIVRNYLMNKIDRFRKKHPKIVIELIDLSTSALIDKLEERKVDFVIDSSPVESLYNNIEIKPICSLSTCFVKSKDNEKKFKYLSDLENENLILPLSRSSLRKNLENYLFEGDIKINSVLEFETEELIIDAARRNLGIGYVVKPAVQYLVDANILEYIDIKEDLPGMEINLVYINSYLTNIAKIFIEEEISSDII